jgi:HEAT repeat protein
MLPRAWIVSLVVLIGAAATPAQPQEAQARSDETVLRQAGLATTPEALRGLVREHAAPEAPPATVAKLIAQLGAADFDERESACIELIRLGRGASPALQRALGHADAEVRRRARFCLTEIEGRLAPRQALAAVRLLCLRQVPGAARDALAFLPLADPDARGAILAALEHVSPRDEVSRTACREALSDSSALRRAAAALLLGRIGTEAERARVREALRDREAEVRLRAAQGLLAGRDPAAFPALIELLNRPALEIAWQAEELLHWAAGDMAPEPVIGAGAQEARKECVAEWQKWWKGQSGRFDWDRLARDHRRPGLYLVGGMRLFLCGCDGKVRWQLDDVIQPSDLRWVAGNRILYVDQDTDRVVERDLTGKIVWEWKPPAGEVPSSCRRLAGGNTLVVTDERIHEVTPRGQVLYSIAPQGDRIVYDACLVGPQRLACLSDTVILLIDTVSHAVLARIPARGQAFENGRIEPLPDGNLHVLIPGAERLLHLDLTGQVLLRREVPELACSALLPNGNVLAGTPRGENRLLEITPDGRTVWEGLLEEQPSRVCPCLTELRLGLDGPRPADFRVDTVAFRVESLKSRDPRVQGRAASDLGDYGPAAESAVAPLIDALGADDADLPRRCAAALARIGPKAVPPLIREVEGGSEQRRTGAASALGQMGKPAEPAVPALVAVLRDRRQATGPRREAARALGAIGQRPAQVVPPLREVLQAESAEVREQAARALGSFPTAVKEAVPALIPLLKDVELFVRIGAAESMTRFGPGSKDAVPAVLEALRETKPAERGPTVRLRCVLVQALGAIGPDAKAASPVLVAMLKDKDEGPPVRQAAMQASVKLGPEAVREALPAFSELLTDVNLSPPLAGTAVAAMTALRKDGVPVLMEAAKKGARNTRRYAINSLGTLGADATPAVPLLTELSKDADVVIRGAATRALRRIPQQPE